MGPEIVAIGFGLVFVAAGMLLVYSALSMRRMVKAAQSWPSVSGRIVKSQLGATAASGSGSSWVAVVEYSYEVDGTPYQNDALALGGATGTLKSRAQACVERYAQGSNVTVYYAPDDPKRACLERRSTNAPIATTIGVVAVLAGSALTVFGVMKAL